MWITVCIGWVTGWPEGKTFTKMVSQAGSVAGSKLAAAQVEHGWCWLKIKNKNGGKVGQ